MLGVNTHAWTVVVKIRAIDVLITKITYFIHKIAIAGWYYLLNEQFGPISNGPKNF